MICLGTVERFCCDDISLIENYDKALNDTTQTWDCHHRLETELNLNLQQLKEKDLYFNRPASELIFLTHGEHTKLHNQFTQIYSQERGKKISNSNKGKKTWNKGIHCKSPMEGKNHSEEARKKQSESMKNYWAQKKGAN